VKSWGLYIHLLVGVSNFIQQLGFRMMGLGFTPYLPLKK